MDAASKSSVLSREGKAVLTGNQAILRGALESGVTVISSYPGGPVTNILEEAAEISSELGLYVEWSTNEKVALEVGIGASLAGQRALVAFKDVGLNAAYDTFMAASRAGCRGGLVLVVGHDGATSPDMQDCRYSVEMAHLLALDPANPQEAKDMTATAFELSERFELPVVIMPSSHICYGTGEVEFGELKKCKSEPFFLRDKSSYRYISVGPTATERLSWLHRRLIEMEAEVQRLKFNDVYLTDSDFGVIVAGHLYNSLTECLRELGLDGKISILKLGSIHPLPTDKILHFLYHVKRALILEELEPYLESRILSLIGASNLGVKIDGKLTGAVPIAGFRKMNASLIKNIIADSLALPLSELVKEETSKLSLCPGCLHRNALYAVKEAVKELGEDDCIITGDQGCSLLLSLEPDRIIDTEYHMGSSIGVAHGLVKGGIKVPVIAAIGDSAFFHNGVSALINAVYNNVDITVLVLDNSITAMTGLNPNPSSGVRADRTRAKIIKIENIARGCGVEFVKVVDPRNMTEMIDALKEAIKFKGVSVVVARGPCINTLEKKD